MPRLKSFLCCVLWCFSLAAQHVFADTGWYSPKLDADPQTGLPARIIVPQIRQANILTAPATLLLKQDGANVSFMSISRLKPDVFVLAAHERGLIIELHYATDLFPYLEWSLTNRTGKTVNLSATLYFPLRPAADMVFLPAAHKPRFVLKQSETSDAYSYGEGPGTRLAMPLAQAYSPGEDWGLAIFGELGELVENFSVKINRTDKNVLVAVTLPLPHMAPGTASGRIYFAATRGDWRPALGAVLAGFPNAFVPHSPEVASIQGPFVNSTGTPANSDIAYWYSQGARVAEIHGTFPFYGEYVPQDDVWTTLIDDRWHALKTRMPENRLPPADASWRDIKSFVEKKYPPSMTVAKVRDYIDRLHRYGMKGLIYFNPTEAWAPWAADKFPSDRRMTVGGKPIPAWYESTAMQADRERPWGKYLLSQIRRLLHLYPSVDGVFFDQATVGNHKLTELCAEVCRIVRAQGKICWWNGPYNMELAALADGMMTEGGGSERYRENTEIVQYYGLAGKPIVSLGPVSGPAYADMLLHGVIPQPVSRSQHEMVERWFPLFGWLRDRRWVLDAHALDVTPGIDANLFQVANGNLVVPVVPESTSTDKPETIFDVGITLRVPDANDVRGVYLLMPDLLGYHKLAFTRDGDALHVTVPRLSVAALLVFAKTGVFSALEGELSVARGQRETLRWIVDNWTTQPINISLLVASASVRARDAGEVSPWSSRTLEFPVDTPATEIPGGRLRILTSLNVGKQEKKDKAELWIDPPLLLTVDAPSGARDDEIYPLSVNLLGHLPAVTAVDLKIESPDWQFENPSARVLLKPEIPTIVRFKGQPLRAGATRIRVIARRDGRASASAEIPVKVLATAMAPNDIGLVRSAELVFDSFGVDGGLYAHKPVFLDGVLVGDLPPGNGDQWVSGVSLPLSPEVIKVLRAHNTVVVNNQMGDAFKVRNFRILLHMRGDVTVTSATDTGPYTAGTGWLHAEGKQFPVGVPLTGITVNIRFDSIKRKKSGTARSIFRRFQQTAGMIR